MALIDLWNSDRDQILGKRVSQLISFAGEGRLRDGNETAREFRELLGAITSDLIGDWIECCLEDRFNDFGFVLQDVVNELGRRLGFEIQHGVYRGHSNEGFDGLWRISGGRAILVESKSSTSYSISLSRISEYRLQVPPHHNLRPEDISILIVVGEEETTEFEAQVRGSRYAWDIRLLGVKALFRLLKLKESLDDPIVERQIQEILFPQEFTRLDRIIDLVFATAEDAQDVESPQLDDVDVPNPDAPRPKAGYHLQVVPRLEKHFGQTLVQRTRSHWSTPDDSILVSLRVSKKFDKGNHDYWFGFKRTSREILQLHGNAHCAFALGSPDRVVVLPLSVLEQYLDDFFTSPDRCGDVRHWHVRFVDTDAGVALLTERDRVQLDVTSYMIPG